MKGKYRGVAEGPVGNLEDPMAVRTSERAPNTLWLGLRLGGGMFDDGATSARVGGAVGATVRYALGQRVFASGRLDWSRRGGAAIDVLGASGGAGVTITRGIALIAQLRGDVRLGETMDASTLGASAAEPLRSPCRGRRSRWAFASSKAHRALAGARESSAVLLEVASTGVELVVPAYDTSSRARVTRLSPRPARAACPREVRDPCERVRATASYARELRERIRAVSLRASRPRAGGAGVCF